MQDNINQLIKGYQSFRKKFFSNNTDLYDDLVKYGQSPNTMVIACSDSRVDPAIVLNCKPGDLFVVRNVANLVPPYQPDDNYHGTSSALEFAVNHLHVSEIVILGHSQCGGIRSLVDNGPTPPPSNNFISKWMELALSANKQAHKNHPDATMDEKAHHCTHYAIVKSLENLKTFPWILEKINKGELNIHGWFFNLSTGLIDSYNFEKQDFEEIS
jgi:carbonic anhydrase